jgi:hypothetical protein
MQKQRKREREIKSAKMREGLTLKERIALSEEITKINRELKNPPEYNKIQRKSYQGDDVGKKIIGPLKAVSNDSKIRYEDYIMRMYIISENCKKASGDRGVCDVAPIVKLQDAIDNTESLEGTSGNAQLKRLGRNIILGNHTYSFLERNNISKKDNFLIWDRLEKLIYLSANKTDEYESDYLLKSKTVKDKILIKDHYDLNFIYVSNLFSEINQGVMSLAEKVLPKEILRNLYKER